MALDPDPPTAAPAIPPLGATAPDGRLLPTSAERPRWWGELAVIVWFAWIYDLISNLPAEREKAAMAHGWALLRLERRLHLDPELAWNQWLAHHHTLGLLAADYYDNAHFVVTFAVIGWLWWRHPGSYRPLRNTLIIISAIGFFVYWAYPTAPPRLLAGSGTVDIVAQTHAWGGWHSGVLAHVANQFAAMPSLHLAWAAWSALAVWWIVRQRHPRWAWAAWIYPVLTFLDVTATANHTMFDCAAGLATTAVATVMAFGLERFLAPRRPLWRRGVVTAGWRGRS